MGAGRGRAPSPGGIAVSKATPAHEGRASASASRASAQHTAAGGHIMSSTGGPGCQLGSTGSAICRDPALHTCQDASPRTKYDAARV